MQTTISIDDELIARAQDLTGLIEPSELVRESLRALIHRESSLRLSQLGGSEPDLAIIPRRRFPPDVD